MGSTRKEALKLAQTEIIKMMTNLRIKILSIVRRKLKILSL